MTSSLLLLALAISLDNLNVGLTYGLRKVEIPVKSILVIALCSGMALLVAMVFGEVIESILPEKVASEIGGFILIVLGAWILYQFFKQQASDLSSVEQTQKPIVFRFEIRSIGLVISIMKKPLNADIDQSGTISGIEAVLLGVALSLDAFGAGLGAAMLDYPPIALAVITFCMSFLFVVIGMKIGHHFANSKWLERISFLPGFVLILLGIWRI